MSLCLQDETLGQAALVSLQACVRVALGVAGAAGQQFVHAFHLCVARGCLDVHSAEW